MLKNYRVDISKEDLKELFSYIDTNSDGKITFDEFFAITTDPWVAKGEPFIFSISRENSQIAWARYKENGSWMSAILAVWFSHVDADDCWSKWEDKIERR